MKKLTSFIFTLAFLFLFTVPSHSADHGNTTNKSEDRYQEQRKGRRKMVDPSSREKAHQCRKVNTGIKG